MVKILSLSAKSAGGAFIGLSRRARALRNCGAKVDIYVYSDYSLSGNCNIAHESIPSNYPDGNIQPIEREVKFNKTIIVDKNKYSSSCELFTKSTSLIKASFLNELADKYDVVNFNWAAGLIEYEGINCLKDKRIIWNLSDMNSFTGGCHFPGSCINYKLDCANCPAIIDDKDMAHKSWSLKIKALRQLKNLTIIAPSQYLACCARESSIFKEFDVYYIPNPAPLDDYQYYNKIASRAKLGISLRARYILFISDNFQNPRKGFKLLVNALNQLSSNLKDVVLLLYGNGKAEIESIHIKSIIIDKSIHKNINHVYSAADVTIFPSFQENAPLIPIESILSGTPVIAHTVGDIETYMDNDLVYICDQNPRSFTMAIETFFSEKIGQSHRAGAYIQARKLISSVYSEEQFARKYLELCEQHINL